MTRRWAAVLAVAALATAGAVGYLAKEIGSPAGQAVGEKPASLSGSVLYYRDPDNKPSYSAVPRTTSDGRPYRAVMASEEPAFPQFVADQKPASPAARRVLHYRHPMGLPDVSPTPKKDSMGMDYIAVYEGDEDESGAVRISPARIQRTGVVSAKVVPRVVSEIVRAPGTIQLDERRIATITLRAEAFVESVENITTGTEVRKDQPLMRIYSPAITSAAAEYSAVIGSRTDPTPRGSRQKLMNLAVPDAYIAEIERTRQAPLTLVWTAPRDGVVLERNVVEGMRAMPGDVLFRIADHSVVWALVDVPEARLAPLKQGQPVTLRTRSFPERAFAGTVALVYPHLNAATRTVRVRIELPNPDFALRPDMYVLAEIDTGSSAPALAVPESAVVDTGDRQFVILDKGEGRFEPRAVQLGGRGNGYVAVRDGVKEGDVVVTSATFLIDAESNLKSALKGIAGESKPQ